MSLIFRIVIACMMLSHLHMLTQLSGDKVAVIWEGLITIFQGYLDIRYSSFGSKFGLDD